MIFKVLLSR